MKLAIDSFLSCLEQQGPRKGNSVPVLEEHVVKGQNGSVLTTFGLEECDSETQSLRCRIHLAQMLPIQNVETLLS